jgi:hypothetical protein
MGHYDSDYEHDDEQRRKERAKQYKKFKKLIHELRGNLEDDDLVPQRFVESLEDLENWISVNYLNFKD